MASRQKNRLLRVSMVRFVFASFVKRIKNIYPGFGADKTRGMNSTHLRVN